MKSINELELHELYYLIYIVFIHGEETVNYDINEIWKRVNDKYYYETTKMLDVYDVNDRTILFNWLRKKARYPLLNALMTDMLTRFIYQEPSGIDNRDLFFVDNINIMNEIINYEFKVDNEDVNLSFISKYKIISTIKEILLEIDPTGEWLKMYEELLLNNKIIYLNELNPSEEVKLKEKLGIKSLKYIDNSCISIGKDKKQYIFLKYTNTIDDITTTIHELTHYISKHYNKTNEEEPLLREFPSIFFELYALKYLSKTGYDKLEITYINNKRLQDTKMASNESKAFIYYLKMLIDNGIITENIDKEYNHEKKCDKCIKDLIINQYTFFEIYPYISGNYLANKAIKKIDEDIYLLSMIKYMTENVSSVDINNIFNIIVPELNIKNDENIKKKQKRIQKN